MIIRTVVELGRYIPLETYRSLIEMQDRTIESRLPEALAKVCEALPHGSVISAILAIGYTSIRHAALLVMSEVYDLSQLYEHPAYVLLMQLYDHPPSYDKGMRTDEAPLDYLLSHLTDGETYSQGSGEAMEALEALSFVLPARIRDMLENHPSPKARGLAIRIMGRAGQQTPVHKLLAALNDEEYEVWSAAQEAIAGLREPDLAGSLLQALPHLDLFFRLDLFQALVQMGREIPAEPLFQELGHLDFTDLKHMDVETVPLRAAHLLKQAHPALFQRVVSQAVDILQGGPVTGVFEPRIQSRLAQTLAWMGHATQEQILLLSELLASPHWQVRIQAAEALGSIECRLPEGIIHRLVELRDGPHTFERIRRAAEAALSKRGIS